MEENEGCYGEEDEENRTHKPKAPDRAGWRPGQESVHSWLQRGEKRGGAYAYVVEHVCTNDDE